jgi:hypothetical protein
VLEFSLPEGHAIVPVAIILRTICPFHDTSAMSEVLEPLSLIDGSIRIFICLYVLFLVIRIECFVL